jgi:hypothetical protein
VVKTYTGGMRRRLDLAASLYAGYRRWPRMVPTIQPFLRGHVFRRTERLQL